MPPHGPAGASSLRGVHGGALMAVNEHHLPIFPKLEPRTPWTGGRLAETDLVNLGEAAHFASKHAGVEITTADFLRAAGRGEIPLRAISPRTVVMLPCRGSDKPMTVPAGGIPTLPLDACKALSNTGRAMWRTYDGFEHVEEWGELRRFTRWQLPDNEADLLTTPDECRLTGRDVHALADAYVDQLTPQEMPHQSQSNNERRFIYWASIPEDKPVKVGEIPSLVAEAIQTNELAQAAAEMNVWEEIKRLVRHEAWTVRNPLDLGPHTFPHGQALKDAVIFPWEAVKWFEHWGVGLRFLPAGNGPELWNLSNAATAIANQVGWHIGARDTLLEQMMQAVRDRVLTVRHPHTDRPYWPNDVRDFYELVTPADVNQWLALDPGSSLRWNTGEVALPESTIPDNGLRLDAEEREALKRARLAEQAATGWYYLDEAAADITRQRGLDESCSTSLLERMKVAVTEGLLEACDAVHLLPVPKGTPGSITQMVRRESVNKWLERTPAGYVWETDKALQAATQETAQLDYNRLATPTVLAQAFGQLTGMQASWFNDLGKTHRLRSARKSDGRAGRSSLEPLFDIIEVAQWLVNQKPRFQSYKPASEKVIWNIVRTSFPNAYLLADLPE